MVTFVHSETVRLNDCDPMGHLNNAICSTYLEQARLAYVGDAEQMPQADIILARTEIDFRAPAPGNCRENRGRRRHVRRRLDQTCTLAGDAARRTSEQAESAAQRSGRSENTQRRLNES